jgi:hypothetical protein
MGDVIPNIDFELIPRGLEGLWVVLQLGENQQVLGQGESPQEALRESRVDPSDPRFALTQVPQSPTAAWMTHTARPNS